MTENNNELNALIERAKKKDNEACASLMKQTGNMLYFLAYSYVRNQEDAKDIVQNAYIKAFTSLDTLTDTAKFNAWLKKITSNEALNYMNRAYERYNVNFSGLEHENDEGNVENFEVVDTYEGRDPQVRYEKLSRAEILDQIIRSLSDQQRIVIMKYYFEDQKISEIAEELKCSENTVKTWLRRAKQSIETEVRDLEAKEEIRLYNIAPYPFFLWLLLGQRKTNEAGFARSVPKVTEVQGVQNPAVKPENLPETVVKKVIDTISTPAAQGTASAAAVTAAAVASAGTGTGAAAGTAAASAETVTAAATAGTAVANGGTAAATGTAAGTAAAGSAAAGILAGIGGKIAVAAVAGAVLIGGGAAVSHKMSENRKDDNPVISEEAKEEDVQETGETEALADPENGIAPAQESVIWVHEPDIRLDGIRELKTDWLEDEFNSWFEELSGYPQEWDYTQSTAYTPDSIEVVVDGKHGIYDYSGNVLFEPVVEAYSDSFGIYAIEYRSDVGMYYSDPSKSYETKYGYMDHETHRFAEDFRTALLTEPPGGIGGDPGPALSNLNGALVFAGYDGSIMPCEDSTIDFYRLSLISQNILIPMIDEQANVIGYSLYDANCKHVLDIPGSYICDLLQPDFVNGFSVFSETETYYDREKGYLNNGNRALYNMTTGQPITEFIYEDAKWFEDGYCPVKRDGKWGFIDENGTEVTDIIFDDVSSLYQGKAYVGLNGMYGILDLKATREGGIPVTLETCYGDSIPEELPESEKKQEETIIGRAVVKVNNLNSRDRAGTDGTKLDQAQNGAQYPVYEIVNNEGYTWYRIEEHRWIADKNGEWVDYLPE